MYVRVGLEERQKKKEKRKKKRKAFRVLKYCVQGFEICNVEGSLKGGKKETKMLKPSSIA